MGFDVVFCDVFSVFFFQKRSRKKSKNLFYFSLPPRGQLVILQHRQGRTLFYSWGGLWDVFFLYGLGVRALVGLVTLKSDLLAIFSLPKPNCREGCLWSESGFEKFSV